MIFRVSTWLPAMCLLAGVAHAAPTYVPYSPMPPNDSARMRWITGEAAVVKDALGGDLVGFFTGASGLHAAVSRNDGDSWNWVEPADTIAVAMPNTIVQTDDGKVHVLSDISNSAGLGYSRIALVRDSSGHVTGFGAEVTNLIVPVPLEFGELRVQLIAGRDQAGNPALFYAVYDWPASTANWARVQAGKTSVAAGLSPDAPSDFVSLADGPGATVVAHFGGASSFASPHNNGVMMAQHPVSRDLWFQYGPLDTGDTITSNTYPIVRQRATPTGASTWSVGQGMVVDGFSGGYASEIGPVVSTGEHVWFVRVSSANGIVIDKADAGGNVTPNALPSPYPKARLGAWTCFAMDMAETQAFVGGWIVYVSGADPRARWSSHWNGAQWVRSPADTDLPDSNGLGCSTGWDEGLVLMLLDTSSAFPYSGAPSFATLRNIGTAQPLVFADGFE